MASEEGIRVRIGADNSELRRKLEESAEASRAFQEKMVSHLEGVRNVVLGLAGANGLGLINQALGGFGGAESAAQKFGQTLIDACKAGLKSIGELSRAAKDLGRELGDQAAGQDLVDKIVGISGHRGSQGENLAAAKTLVGAGYSDEQEVVDLLKKLQDLSARFKLPLGELAETFAQAKQLNFRPLQQLIREHSELARWVQEGVPGGLTASPAKDEAAQKAARQKEEASDEQLAALRQERARLAERLGAGPSPRQKAEAQIKPLEQQLSQLEAKPEDDPQKAAQAALKQQIEQIRQRADQEEQGLEHARQSNQDRAELARIDAKIKKVAQERLIAEGERVSADWAAQHEPRVGVAKALEEAPEDNADRVLQALLGLTGPGKTAEGAAEARAGGIPGKMADLSQELDRLKRSLAEALAVPVVSALKEVLDAFVKNLPAATGAAKEFGTELGKAVTLVKNVLLMLAPHPATAGAAKADQDPGLMDRLKGAALNITNTFLELEPQVKAWRDAWRLADVTGMTGRVASPGSTGQKEAADKLSHSADKLGDAADQLDEALSPQQ